MPDTHPELDFPASAAFTQEPQSPLSEEKKANGHMKACVCESCWWPQDEAPTSRDATNASNISDILTRMGHLEREVRDLRRELYTRTKPPQVPTNRDSPQAQLAQRGVEI